MSHPQFKKIIPRPNTDVINKLLRQLKTPKAPSTQPPKVNFEYDDGEEDPLSDSEGYNYMVGPGEEGDGNETGGEPFYDDEDPRDVQPKERLGSSSSSAIPKPTSKLPPKRAFSTDSRDDAESNDGFTHAHLLVAETSDRGSRQSLSGSASPELVELAASGSYLKMASPKKHPRSSGVVDTFATPQSLSKKRRLEIVAYEPEEEDEDEERHQHPKGSASKHHEDLSESDTEGGEGNMGEYDSDGMASIHERQKKVIQQRLLKSKAREVLKSPIAAALGNLGGPSSSRRPPQSKKQTVGKQTVGKQGTAAPPPTRKTTIASKFVFKWNGERKNAIVGGHSVTFDVYGTFRRQGLDMWGVSNIARDTPTRTFEELTNINFAQKIKGAEASRSLQDVFKIVEPRTIRGGGNLRLASTASASSSRHSEPGGSGSGSRPRASTSASSSSSSSRERNEGVPSTSFDKCIMCANNAPTVSVTTCDHKIFCALCAEGIDLDVESCTVCGAH